MTTPHDPSSNEPRLAGKASHRKKELDSLNEQAPPDPKGLVYFSAMSESEADNLNRVAEYFGESLYEVCLWKRQGCPAFSTSPHSLVAIAEWRRGSPQTQRDIDEGDRELSRQKLQSEIQKIETENRSLLEDPEFWLAAIASGLTVSNEVREWLSTLDEAGDATDSPVRERSHRRITFHRGMMIVKFDAIDWIELQQNEFRLIMDSSSMYVHLYHPTGVVCDFGNVEYVGSTTLEALIRFSRRHRSIRMAVVTGSDAIIEVLSITSLDRIFAVYRDIDEAIESLTRQDGT